MSADAPSNTPPKAAADLGVISCKACALVQRLPPPGVKERCPRCNRVLAARKPGGTARPWAYLAAATALYIPANLLPIMHTTLKTEHRDDTIMSGVIYLWRGGSWDLALIVFIASIIVPAVKITALASILWTTDRGITTGERTRSRMFHMLELIGHWSMLDVFVVALLVTLVKFGAFADISPRPGVILFAAVVVLTMLASGSFDPRLIWDRSDREKVREGELDHG